MADIIKPIIKDLDVWARSAEEKDILVPYDKIDEGYSYANKPSYQSFNWFLKQSSQFLVHMNQNGVPEWNKETEYASSGFVKYDGLLFQTFSETTGVAPSSISRTWSSTDFLDGLHDVEIDLPEDNDLLIGQYDTWNNISLPEIRDVKLNDLYNVTVTEHPDTILVSNADNPNNPDSWVNQDIDDVLRDNIFLNDMNDVILNTPIQGEVFQYKTITVKDNEGNDTETLAWTNVYDGGKTNWNKLQNLPEEFNPYRADRDTVGGVRIWVDGETLYVENTDKETVPAPYDLKVTTETSPIVLEWSGTTLARHYAVYRDNVHIGDTNIGETTYSDDSASIGHHHFYYVKSVNANGIESYPSNYVIGVVRS